MKSDKECGRRGAGRSIIRADANAPIIFGRGRTLRELGGIGPTDGKLGARPPRDPPGRRKSSIHQVLDSSIHQVVHFFKEETQQCCFEAPLLEKQVSEVSLDLGSIWGTSRGGGSSNFLAFLSKDDERKAIREVLSSNWRYCVLILTVVGIMATQHYTSGYWELLPIVLFSPVYSFVLFELLMELAGLRFGRALWLLSSVSVIIWYWRDTHYTLLDYITLPLALLSIPICSMGLSDCSTSGEKFLVYAIVMVITLSSMVSNELWDHPCVECAPLIARMVTENILPTSGLAGLTQHGNRAWHFFLEQEVPQECVVCYSAIASATDIISDYRLAEDNFYSGSLEYERQFRGDVCIDDFEESVSSSKLRVMDEWYTDITENSLSNKSGRQFIEGLAMGVSGGYGKELLGNATKDFLCSPSSRIGPPPSDFLLRLNRPLFTGESSGDGKPMDISISALLAIIRGDTGAELGPHVCFLIRLAGLIPEDTTVTSVTINPANIAPVQNERLLKGAEVSFLYPSLYISKTDEDNDIDGATGDIFEALLSLYVQLPMKDWDPIFFDSKEEYIAFFRWNVEHSMQDEFYLPKWLSHGGAVSGDNDEMEDISHMRHAFGELVANQAKYRSDRLTLTDPTSDETLSDRAFFGTGMKEMTAIKLPNDGDYGYLHPAGPEYFDSDEQRDFFRTSSDEMPSDEELKQMGDHFWKGQIDIPLMDYRKRVVQVDYTVTTHWKLRDMFDDNGSILYLDAESRKPMGIWVASQRRIVMPNAGRRWDHAKFYHRSTELHLMALRHVAEYHIGWANTFSTALRQTLPQHHGLRAFLKPYTHGTGAVNWNAYQMLLRDDSILHRASGLTRRGRGFSWGHIQKHMDYTTTLPEQLEAKKLGGMSNLTSDIPMFNSGLLLWNVHRRFTEGYIQLLYPNDELIQSDTDLYRFWNHINTLGRHTDPCICGMDDNVFFDSGSWPSLEEDRTCSGLLDHEQFSADEEDEAQRRNMWCKRHAIERTRALYRWLEDDCETDPRCPGLSYDLNHMRNSMKLPPLERKILIDVLTNFIFEVTVGHEMAADNIPYMVDPSYGGVRLLRQKDAYDEPPLMVDIATYIYGTVISGLTTIRSMPLLSDWSNLLVYWVDDHTDKAFVGVDRSGLKKQIRKLHLKYKADLTKLSNDMLQETLKIPQNRRAPYMNPSTQACSVAV